MSGLEKIPNIEEDERPQQMTGQEERAILKSPFYDKKAMMEMAFEQVFAQLYATILQDKETIRTLTLELAKLKKVAKTQPNVTNPSPNPESH